MKRKEFISKLSEMGLGASTVIGVKYIDILDGAHVIARVYEDTSYNFTLTPKAHTYEYVDDLIPILVAYASEEVDQRIQPEKYVWKLKGVGKKVEDEDTLYFNYYSNWGGWGLETREPNEYGDVLTQFSVEDFTKLKSQLGITLGFEKEEITDGDNL